MNASLLVLFMMCCTSLVFASPRITEGERAVLGQFPFQARVMISLLNNSNQETVDKTFCGGSVISSKHVLTAAHCINFTFTLVNMKTAIEVFAGGLELNDSFGQWRKVIKATTDQFFNRKGQYDYAVLELDDPLEFNDFVRPIRLGNPAQNATAMVCFASGYGQMDPDDPGSFPRSVRFVEMTVISDSECKRLFQEAQLPHEFPTPHEVPIHPTTICARGTHGGGACWGDSGGPLSCEVDDELRLFGSSSWAPFNNVTGEGCFQDFNGKPVANVFAEAASVYALNFINESCHGCLLTLC